MNIHELEGAEELVTSKDLQILSAELKGAMSELRADLHKEINIQTRWMMSGLITLFIAVIGLYFAHH